MKYLFVLSFVFLSYHSPLRAQLIPSGGAATTDQERMLEALKQSGMIRQEGNHLIFKVKKASDTPQIKMMYGAFFASDKWTIGFDVDGKYFASKPKKPAIVNPKPIDGEAPGGLVITEAKREPVTAQVPENNLRRVTITQALRKPVTAEVPSTPLSPSKPELIVIDNVAMPADMPNEVIIPKRQWEELFTNTFARWRLTLLNYTRIANRDTADNTYKFFLRNSSSLTAGRQQIVFSPLPFRMNPATIYFQNIQTFRTTMTVSGGEIIIKFTFTGYPSPELPANCIDNFACNGNGMWYVKVYSHFYNLYVTPVLEDGKIVFSGIRSRASGSKRSDGVNAVVANWDNTAFWRGFADAIEDKLFSQPVFKDFFWNCLLDEINRTGGVTGTSTRLPYTRLEILPSGDMKLSR